ncbi:universal stress protein [Fluviibacterium sp. DFM31]|uniref:Universal stress protein n=1 Tax=Meridianimarinicoccus marinus TaxID=3231483 RepID=A0ABV3L208_9RHOB
MFKRIMMPIDLRHLDSQARALTCAHDLAKLYDATVIYVGVTAAAPTEVAHTPAEYKAKLAGFATGQAGQGIATESHAIIDHDPAVDLDGALLQAVKDTGADLVVMASHDPGILNYVWPTNGGKIAGHAHVSVLVVR